VRLSVCPQAWPRSGIRSAAARAIDNFVDAELGFAGILAVQQSGGNPDLVRNT
jgi:hypothetical protein